MLEDVVKWNMAYPLDKWWREKYKVPFMSKIHREANFLDQLFEFQEEKLFIESKAKKYTPNVGDFLKTENLSQEEVNAYELNVARDRYKDFEELG
jgi:hypothetical protein